MHLDVGFAGFLIFTFYYIILKAVLQVINLEYRRMGKTVPAGISGLFA
jgi:hypothetical protein